MKNILLAVACRNASGMADMPVFSVEATAEEYDLGIHYDRAEALAEDAGYEPPFVCVDDTERGHILAAARELNLVPQVVAVDVADGQPRSTSVIQGHCGAAAVVETRLHRGRD